MSLDLFTATPAQIRALLEDATDPRLRAALEELEVASRLGDEEARVSAVLDIYQRVVLEMGVGL